MAPQTYNLPRTLSIWPWDRTLNPHYAIAGAESAAWIQSFKPFTAKDEQIFNKTEGSTLFLLSFF
jgi:hypothetical protein